MRAARSKSMMPSAGAEIPVRLRLEVERARLAVAPHFDVVGGALRRPARSRAADSAAPAAPASRWCSTESSWTPSCLICCARGAIGFLDRRACLCPAASRCATSSPDVFCCRFSPSTSGISRRRAVSSVAMSSSALSVIEAAVAEAGPDVFDVIAHECRIEHAHLRPSILYSRSAVRESSATIRP